MTITSSHNEKLKTLRKLRQRRRDRERLGQFVAEGEDLLAAADAAGWVATERFAVSGSGLPGIEVDPAALKSVTELASGTRTLAIYDDRWEVAPLGDLCVYLHAVSDPGNVGTVLRSAEAFGASCVALGPGSADPYGPRAVRASMGAIFTVPVIRCDADALPGLKIGLDADPRWPLLDDGTSLPADAGAISLLVGAEREGLPGELLDQCPWVRRIEIGNHSLNAGVAASIALYELTRRIRPA
jgi:TrmH family RNA methyltransferase